MGSSPVPFRFPAFPFSAGGAAALEEKKKEMGSEIQNDLSAPVLSPMVRNRGWGAHSHRQHAFFQVKLQRGQKLSGPHPDRRLSINMSTTVS